MTLRQVLRRNRWVHAALLPLVTVGRRLRRWYHLQMEARRLRNFDRVRRWCEATSRKHGQPIFVKVGANDGVTGDPCSAVILAHQNWQGVLIEPVPSCAHRLRVNFKDSRFTVLQCAIGECAGQLPFFAVDEEQAKQALGQLPDWFDQLGSFSREHICNHLEGQLEPFIVTLQVDVRRLDDVLRQQGIKTMQLLHIDTEGHDLRVLRSMSLEHIRPEAILIEHKHLAPSDQLALKALLHANGYRWIDCGGTDLFATLR